MGSEQISKYSLLITLVSFWFIFAGIAYTLELDIDYNPNSGMDFSIKKDGCDLFNLGFTEYMGCIRSGQKDNTDILGGVTEFITGIAPDPMTKTTAAVSSRIVGVFGYMLAMLTFQIKDIPILFTCILDIMAISTGYLIYMSIRGD